MTLPTGVTRTPKPSRSAFSRIHSPRFPLLAFNQVSVRAIGFALCTCSRAYSRCARLCTRTCTQNGCLRVSDVGLGCHTLETRISIQIGIFLHFWRGLSRPVLESMVGVRDDGKRSSFADFLG